MMRSGNRNVPESMSVGHEAAEGVDSAGYDDDALEDGEGVVDGRIVDRKGVDDGGRVGVLGTVTVENEVMVMVGKILVSAHPSNLKSPLETENNKLMGQL